MPEPKWLSGGGDPKTKKRMSKNQERRTAKGYSSIGARTTVGSGNKFEKGDVTVGREKMIECKTTAKTQITVKEDWLSKLITEAHREGKEPIFQFGFQGLDIYGKSEWQAVPQNRMEELMIKEKMLQELLDVMPIAEVHELFDKYFS